MRGCWGRFAVALASLMSACAPSSPLPDMEAGEIGRVVRVIDGDALALNTGQSVRLIGIEAPALRPRGRDPDAYAVESQRVLEDMVLGREVQLYYSGMTRDRYDRALAHVVTTDGAGPILWLNMELVERGAARVRFYPDTAVREEDFLKAEAGARAARRGLWDKTAYRISSAASVNKDMRGFMIVEAELSGRRAPDGKYAANQMCLREIFGADLIIEVRKDAASICDLPSGQRYRVRGWVSGQRLDLTLAHHVEPLE